jgi:hypothetical protein
LTVLTCNNGSDAMGILERSAQALGVPCLVRGLGISPWINSRHKPLIILEALRQIETEYTLYADSRDAVILGNLRSAVERFVDHRGCDLLFGGDRINWPALPEFRRFELSIPGARETQFRFLNGGAWIGKTSFCQEFFSEAVKLDPVPEVPDSEQGILKKLLPKFYPRVQLDYRCEIFQNIGFVLSDIFDVIVTPAEGF